MPSAGVGFATSIAAVGKAQKLAAIFVSPLSVWNGDWLSVTSKRSVDAASGISTRLATKS